MFLFDLKKLIFNSKNKKLLNYILKIFNWDLGVGDWGLVIGD